MPSLKTYNVKQILTIVLWCIISISTIVLMLAASNKKNNSICKQINISFKGNGTNFFIDKNDILNIIKTVNSYDVVGKNCNSINIKASEKEIEKNVWVYNAELFFDNDNILQVKIEEKLPIARLFTSTGSSFYIDSTLSKLPLSEKYTARIPVFTGNISDKIILSPLDSVILKQIAQLSIAILKDSFCNALIDQIDVTNQATFVLMPKIGNYTIQFGVANNIEQKLDKLKLFYKKIISNENWNKYSALNLEYVNQIVAKRRDATDIAADSIKAIEMLQLIASNAAAKANDSLQNIVQDNNNNGDSILIDQSIERDEDDIAVPAKPSSTTNTVAVKPKPVTTVAPTKKGSNQNIKANKK